MGMLPQSATTGIQAAQAGNRQIAPGQPNIQQILQMLQTQQGGQQGIQQRQLPPQMGNPNAPQFMQRLTGPAAIAQAYQRYLGRNPEPAGAAFWNQARQNGMDMNAIRSSIYGIAQGTGRDMGNVPQPLVGNMPSPPVGTQAYQNPFQQSQPQANTALQPALNQAPGFLPPPRALPQQAPMPGQPPSAIPPNWVGAQGGVFWPQGDSGS